MLKQLLMLAKDMENQFILKIDAIKMFKDGFKFYESKNGVVLVDEVPSKYIDPLPFGNQSKD